MKKIVFYALTVIFIIFYAFLFSGLMGLVGDHGLGKDGSVHNVHHLGSGLVIVFVVSGLASQLLKYGEKIAGFQQVLATLLGLIVMAFIVGDPDNYGGNKGIFDLAFLIFVIPVALLWLLHPLKKKMLSFSFKRANKPLLVIFALLLVPLFVYGVQQSLLQRNSYPPLSDIHHQHWNAMGTIAFATVFTGLLGAMQTRGYFLPLVLSTASLLILGIVSVLNPEAPSSLGSILGFTSLISGLFTSWFTYKEFINLKVT